MTQHALDLLNRLIDTAPTCDDSVLVPADNSKSSGSTPTANASADPPAISCSSKTPPRDCPTDVTVVDADSLTSYQFIEQYMAPNLPVLIKGACKGWSALDDWSTADGQINMTYLRQLAGQSKVTVTDTARHHEGCGPTMTMTFDQYCDWWEQHHKQQQQPPQQQYEQQDGDVSAQSEQLACNRKQCQQHEQQHKLEQQQQHDQNQYAQQQKQALWYLKDWHFAGEFPQQQVYETPKYFTKDWLNEYYDAKQQRQHCVQHDCGSSSQSASCSCPVLVEPVHGSSSSSSSANSSSTNSGSSVVTCDYRFVYCGPAGSWTPVHADVLRSYSWSANIVGRKRWWLLPPQHTHLLLDNYGHTCTDFFGPVLDPLQQQRQQQWQQHLLEVEQGVGDVLFVPSGWHHMVVNEVDTLSINHNWTNAHNIHWSWALLKHEHHLATQQLEDCRETATAVEFEQLVQKMLAANSGFSFQDFARHLMLIIQRRLHAVQQIKLQLEQLQQHDLIGLPGLRQHGHDDKQPAVEADTTSDSCQNVTGGLSTNVGLQLQLMHFVLDLKRASDVVQQVQQTYVAAALHNEEWYQQHRIYATSVSWPMPRGGSCPLDGRLACQGGQQDNDDVGAPSVPAWPQEVAAVVQLCHDAVSRALE